ncbi:MAG TPA: ABC transporter ATP-binding protein [Thermodesulfobacteriota bacterium]|nr:ABC transporter ATP-binding protein [Thermodesulfobacteriota bacterium]
MSRVLAINDLKTFFYTREGVAKAVNGVSLSLERGELIGLVGESGCGKSVTGLSILRLVPFPGRIVSGEILLEGQDLLKLPADRMRQIRGDQISMIFQEPMISLNPAFTIGDQLVEAIRAHRQMARSEARDLSVEMLRMVEIPEAERRFGEYPHQLSGGMRQRVMIAEALLLRPKVLLADEPTTALDVTIQAQVLDILYKLTQEIGTAIILITHNLGLVAEWTRRVVVMYTGKIAEQGKVEQIFEDARHPYTRGLLRAVPLPGMSRTGSSQALYEIKGIVPSLLNLPAGCAFHPRCPEKKEICSREEPPRIVVDEEHEVSCWLYS